MFANQKQKTLADIMKLEVGLPSRQVRQLILANPDIYDADYIAKIKQAEADIAAVRSKL